MFLKEDVKKPWIKYRYSMIHSTPSANWDWGLESICRLDIYIWKDKHLNTWAVTNYSDFSFLVSSAGFLETSQSSSPLVKDALKCAVQS